MRANPRADTQPELRIRSLLHRRGRRFRKDVLIRTPDGRAHADIVFSGARVAVFVDGCFWHSCPVHGSVPKANRDYWEPKLQRNRQRDEAVSRWLTNAGWRVLRVWEHADPEAAVAEIEAALDADMPVPPTL